MLHELFEEVVENYNRLCAQVLNAVLDVLVTHKQIITEESERELTSVAIKETPHKGKSRNVQDVHASAATNRKTEEGGASEL